jgi:hypothetical protein
MITLLGYLEDGYDCTFEQLAWRQMKAAWDVELLLVGHGYDTVQEALDVAQGHRVFLEPPGRIGRSEEFSDWLSPADDLVFIFGRPGESMVSYIREEDTALHITTPRNTDMMAITVAGIVLYEHR